MPFRTSANETAALLPLVPDSWRRCGAYRVRSASTEADLNAVFRLRFLVFNLELGEGLESAYQGGYDTDKFDEICDHLIVEHATSGRVVGTYRLQTGRMAATRLGFYSAREFDFSPFEPLRDHMLELGRACIHREHRSFDVLTLLWRAIAGYARENHARYLVGCSSLTSQSCAEASQMYWRLQGFLAKPVWQTRPLPRFELPLQPPSSAVVQLPPKLLRAYLSIGARICGPPAIDREFKTIDFLTLLDLEDLSDAARSRFLK
jgi:putative hemolysin